MDTIRAAVLSGHPMTDGTSGDEEVARRDRLTSTRTVALGTLWNLLGRLGPMVVAIISTPFLLAALGVSRFGVFSLALSLIGIFGVFDFGFGRALTRLIAERLAVGEEAKAAPAVLTGLLAMTLLGAVGGVVLAILARYYALHLLDLPPALAAEVSDALVLLCASAPLVVLNAALWGVLSAYQRFAAANLVNLPIMALYYLGPLAVLPFADSLVAVIAVLVACRAVMTACYAWIALRAMPALRMARPDWSTLGGLARFGGWLTISNLSWPLLLYLDRFVIAAVISTAASAWYATPFDLVLRFSIVPIAIMQSGFPAITTAYSQAPEVAARLFRLGCLAIVATLALPTLLTTSAALPLLSLWLGADFAAHAATVLQLLGLGALFMCLDTVPAGLLDAIGRPDINARQAVLTLLIAVPLLAALIGLAGIDGAALAWTLRVIAGFTVRMALCARLYPPVRQEMPRLLPVLVAALLTMAAGMVSWPATAVLAAVGGGVLWRCGLTRGERAYVLSRLYRVQKP